MKRTQRFPDKTIGPWEVEIRFGLVAGRVDCVGLEVRPVGDQPSEPFTTTVLRQIRLGRLSEELRRTADSDLRELVPFPKKPNVGQLGDVGLGPLAVARKRPGPKGPDLAHYQKVARIYLDAKSKPTKTVAAKLNMHHSTAAKHVKIARGLGLIAQTTRGRTSGRPLEQA